MSKKSLDIQYWLNASKEDFQVAKNLSKLGHYSYCLFFCHLSIEKFLKAAVVKETNNYPPYTHDLRNLAKIASLELNTKQKEHLDEIFTFNIAGRYVDTKLKFYQKYNKKDYAQKYLKITEDLLLWLKKEFQKK